MIGMLRTSTDSFSANLIALLTEYGDSIEGFRERVGGDYARGHKEATGGIIAKVSLGLNTLYQRSKLITITADGICALVNGYGSSGPKHPQETNNTTEKGD